MINVMDMTMRYKSGKGIFDLAFAVKEGEAFGYLGPNGAGKTTTIRNLLGFMKPDAGGCTIAGLDCWRQADEIHRRLGYLPGETAFFTNMKGTEFLRLLSDMRGTKDTARQKKLAERFEIDAAVPIRKMSKGMKQKIGIIAAFMHDPARVHTGRTHGRARPSHAEAVRRADPGGEKPREDDPHELSPVRGNRAHLRPRRDHTGWAARYH
jgi:ABC-2 type transport system ATP-binding protein